MNANSTAGRGTATVITPHALALFAEASAALIVAAAIVRFVPFRRVARLMTHKGADAGQGNGDLARAIAEAVERGARRLPLRLVCFQQGLAGQWMLRRRGIASLLHYGIAKTGHDLAAHVWITLDGVTILGGPIDQSYTAVARFPD